MRKPPSFALSLLPWLLLILVLPPALGAQENTGNLAVTVVDAEGKPLPGVNVSVVVGEKAQSHDTDAGGQVRFENLPTGNYTVKCQAEGFATKDSPATIDMSRDTQLKVVLEPAVSGG